MEPFSQVLSEITAALHQLGIPYAIGGSVASSARGIWRATLDVDLVAAMRSDQASDLVAGLGPGWYADADTMRSAIEAGRAFNVIHRGLAHKVDIFPATEEFHLSQLNRATTMPLGAGRVPCAVTTAEDILLAKLRWYRDGGEVSQRQWNDIAGLISTSPALDWTYLRQWAERLRVTDLLEKARNDESGRE